MKKTLIISGGEINQQFCETFIKNNKIDYIIAADKGLELLNNIGILPNYIIGDFDSINKKILEKYNNIDVKIIKLNPEKDFSDTHMALKLAIELESKEVYILGALGSRVDHVIANIHILKEGIDNNIKCKIIDSNNEIQLITKGINKIEKTKHKYISLIPLTTEVSGITSTGLKYSLNNKTLSIGHSIGISNEFIKNDATIIIEKGILIMIKSDDYDRENVDNKEV